MANELENPGTEQNTETSGQKTDTAALEARIKQLESENGKLRQANTNASAEASKFKKQYQELLPEKERLEKEQEEHTAAMQKELEELKAERNVANHKSQFISIGFEDALAQETAQALNAGDAAKVFDGIRKFIASHDKALMEKAMLSNPTLKGGNTEKVVTQEEFNRMGYREMLQFKNEHPDLFAEYSK